MGPPLKERDLRSSFLRTATALAVFFVMLGAWLLSDLHQSRERLLEDVSYRAMQRSQIIAQGFRTEVLAADYVLRDVLGHIQASDMAYPDKDADHAERIRTLLKSKADTVPDFVSMVLFNSECVFLATVTGDNIGVRSKPALCDARRQHQGRGPLVTYVPGKDSASGRSVIVLSRNLSSSEGGFLGGVMSVIELELAQRRFDQFAVGASDAVALLDETQVLLARRPFLTAVIEKRVESPDIPTDVLATAAGANFGEQRDLDGRERLFGFSKIEGFPFVVAYGYDKEHVLAEWRDRAWELGLGYAMLVALTLLAARAHWVIQRQRNELFASRAALQELATHDPLTGLYNRRFLDESLSRELARAEREKQPLAIIMLDIDFFKKINDQYGHAVGDEVLRAVAKLIKKGVRESDLICRYGGEEFLAMMPNMSIAQAVERAEAWRIALETTPIDCGGRSITITLSAGVAVYPDHGTSPEILISRADEMLYKSKRSGRNCTSAFST
jgi:diguanylate cyclase (GGDEF)-like protein